MNIQVRTFIFISILVLTLKTCNVEVPSIGTSPTSPSPASTWWPGGSWMRCLMCNGVALYEMVLIECF